jgi:hypothetical protein
LGFISDLLSVVANNDTMFPIFSFLAVSDLRGSWQRRALPATTTSDYLPMACWQVRLHIQCFVLVLSLFRAVGAELAEACAPSNHNIQLLAYGVLAGAVSWWHQ